jgi:hypothetical protein
MKKTLYVYIIGIVLFSFLLFNCDETPEKTPKGDDKPASKLTVSGPRLALCDQCYSYAMVTLEEGKKRLLAVEDISTLIDEKKVKGGKISGGSVTLNVYVVYLVENSSPVQFESYEPFTGNVTTNDLVLVIVPEEEIEYPLPSSKARDPEYILDNIHLGPTEFINGSAERKRIRIEEGSGH